MLWAVLMFAAADVPPGRDTGFVPLPQQEPPPKPPKAPTGGTGFIQQGTPGASSKPWEARTPEELGYVYIMRKEPFAALTVFQEILRTKPDDVGAKVGKANALFEIARFYQRKGRLDEAKKAYADAIATDPTLELDEDFIWHRDLMGPREEKKKQTNVYDPRPKILQHPWIGPHLRFGAQGLVAPGLTLQPLDFLRVEVGVDPIFAGVSAQIFAHFPWQWSPYLAVGGKLSFQYPPIGGNQRRAGYEVWQASFFNAGIGVQYRHPIGLYFAVGIDMLITGSILRSQEPDPDSNPNPTQFSRVVFPYPFPQVTFGWLFGG